MRRLPLILGLAILGLAWLGPLPRLAPVSFAAHMTMHVAVVAVAAPLIAAGLVSGHLNSSSRFRLLAAPVPLSFAELVVVWGWHVPAAHEAARALPLVLALEQASFLTAGLLLWLACLGQRAAGTLALLVTSIHMTLLGALLALAPRPLYTHADHAAAGPAALDDQHLGGILMLVVGGASYLVGGLWLMARLLSDRAAATAQDRT
jgi:putative membrane protein